MQYELTIKMLVKSKFDEERVVHQFESLFEFGSIRESIAEGLKLLEDPRLSDVAIAKRGRTRPASSQSGGSPR